MNLSMAISKKPRKATRETATFYVRMPRELADRIKARVTERGWPHTFASVLVEAAERGWGEGRIEAETKP